VDHALAIEMIEQTSLTSCDAASEAASRLSWDADFRDTSREYIYTGYVHVRHLQVFAAVFRTVCTGEQGLLQYNER
jgi:hypothetical protein